ncbi:hypothetical protein TraAM80_03164 [Trypanosoma rangeli]|uniref:TATA element modulatory factor 1 TATA binding domain-containing protein n=1 Tax=Trypanosoma rangeli TaxID=5698 RepID=A0A3R7L520_TRYRA|nr:uncharacterized protein TraAM80_03164 [Trypanosoma rangeli]RNF07790.1 hypothetical protein TraAM80_03164 [Trypanosoma rangeli]|eukprot:RNF07790.1 hypothetical protein TraAM80_03164 [Trypanosoma rangeli]
MWGSWLDQIHKKLDDVSGLAEQAIGGVYEEEEEEEEEEGEEENKREEMCLELEGTKKTEEEVTAGKGAGGDRNLLFHPTLTPEVQQETHVEGVFTSSNGAVELQPHSQERGMLMEPVSCGAKSALYEVSATPNEKLTDSVTEAVEGSEADPISHERSPLQSVTPEEVAESPAGAAPHLTADTTTLASVTLKAVHSTAQHIASLHPDGVECNSLAGGGSEEQLLRFQQLLADEMEVSRLLREEKNRLEHRIVFLEKELSSLHLLKKNAVHANMQKMEALEREGSELSRKLGKERERYKSLYEKKTQVENRLEVLEQKIAQFALREEEFQQRIAASHTDCETAKQRAEELSALLKEQEGDVRLLQQQLTSAKQSYAEVVSHHEKEISEQRTELKLQKENTSGMLVSMQQEKEALVSSLQQNQLEYERRIQELESKLIQANRRTAHAEMRLTDHERSALAPLRELRAALDDVERQKKQLMEEVEYWKGEFSAMERGRESEKKYFTQRLADMQSEIQSMQNEKLAFEQELQQSRVKHSQLQRALENSLERASHVEATKEQLTMALEEARRQVDSASNSNNSTIALTPNVRMGESARHQPPSFDESSGGTLRPLFPADAVESVSNVCRSNRSRVDRELVRQAVEIERLRRVEEEGAEAKQKLLVLAAQHDLLMQMYGQLREELQKGQLGQSSK